MLFIVRARRLGYSPYVVFPLLLFGLPVGTIGAHVFNKLIPLIFGLSGPSHTLLGLTVIGSIAACIPYSYFYIKHIIKAQPFKMMDAFAFTFPLSILIGRIGCLMSGCCYGKPSPDTINSSFWSFLTLPIDSYAAATIASQDYIGTNPHVHIWNLPLLFMINSAMGLVITEYLYRNRERMALYPGTAFAAAGALDAAGRFVIEFARKETLPQAGEPISNPWQPVVLLMFSAFFAWLLYCLYKRKTSPTGTYGGTK